MIEDKCAFCKEAIPGGNGYITTLKWHPDGWEHSVHAYGHKRCLMALQNHYKRTGKIMTMKEVEDERFDPSI
jgi:hypothetical protein